MTTREAVTAALRDTFGSSRCPLRIAAAATGIAPAVLRSVLCGERPATLSEVHRVALATGHRTVDLIGGA